MTLDRGILADERELDGRAALLALELELAACTSLVQLRAVLASGLGPLLPVTDRVSIVLLEPDGEWLRIHRILPVTEPRERSGGALPLVRVDGTPVGQVVREGVGRVVADVRADPNITFGHAAHDGIRSTVSAPVRIGTRVVGALNAGSRTPGACTPAMLERMQELAAVAGPAFHAAERALAIRGEQPAGVASPRARSVELVGSSPAFRAMLTAAQRTARSDADVLITGETGVGKTALARALHEWSPRRAAPFVTVHLADLSPTLVESELFGYERGAFTGATAARLGRFESADGGTIFLDEISEAPLAIQAKLLRVIHDRCFERVGGSRTIEARVRIIAATNRDLRAAVDRREFRDDLLFRLSVVPLHVPPLRERRDDLDQLADAILARLGASEGRVRSLAPAARARLHAYAWPGNIRELESLLRSAAILEDTDELALDRLGTPAAANDVASPTAQWATLDEHERAYIEQVLHAHHGVVEGRQGAARVLGVPPSTLRSRMKRLEISVAREKGRTR